jgi:hypothetical protein
MQTGLNGKIAWYQVHETNPLARGLADRHYSRITPGHPLFVGPGEERMILMSADNTALFVWRKTKFRKDDQKGVECSIFRNEGPRISSYLIKEAVKLAKERWPGERLFTYVNGKKIRSTNPGYCFLMAGWERCGISKGGGNILEYRGGGHVL